MSIQSGSRYANRAVEAVTDGNGVTRQTIMPATASAKTFTVIDHVWTAADRPDLLAGQMYGDETMWWVIADANPEILDWADVAPGRVVRLPSAAV